MAEKIVEVDGKRYMKVQKGKYFDKKKNRKMRRHHPVRWILISAFCLLVVAPVGFVFGAFYDPGTKEVKIQVDDYLNAFSERLAVGLAEMPSTQTFELNIDNDFIDGMLMAAKETLVSNLNVGNYIPKMYCYIKDHTYDFCIEAQVSFFKTRIRLSTTIDENATRINSETGKEESCFLFKINEIYLGRLPIANIAMSLGAKYINEENLQKAFTETGIKAKLNLTNKEIVYFKSQFADDMETILGILNKATGNTFANLLLPFFDQLKDSISFKEGIHAKLNFKQLAELPSEAVKPTHAIKFYENVTKYVKYIEGSLNNNWIESTNANNFFNYFVNGSNTEKGKAIVELIRKNESFVENVNKFIVTLDGHDKENYTTYTGDTVISNNKVADIADVLFGGKTTKYSEYTKFKNYSSIEDLNYLNNFIKNTSSEDRPELFQIDDLTLSDFLRSMPIIGESVAMPLKINNEWKFINFSINDINVRFMKEGTQNKLYFCFYIGIYGANIPIVISTNIIEDNVINGRTLNFKIDGEGKNYIGNFEIDSKLFTQLTGFIDSILSEIGTQDKGFSYSNGSFIIDLSKFASSSQTGGDIGQFVSDLISGSAEKKTITVQGIKVEYTPANFNFEKSIIECTGNINALKLNLKHVQQ